MALTPRPAVPALVRATAYAALLNAPGCGDDDGSSDDIHPTAGPCAHDPDSPQCESTGDGSGDGGDAQGTGGDTQATADTTGLTNDDVAPTIPCAHDPNGPGCSSSSDSGTGSGSGSSDSGSDGTTADGTTTG